MKKGIILTFSFLILAFFGFYIYKNNYFIPESQESIYQRRIKIFEKTIKEFENSRTGRIDLTSTIILRWRIKDFKANENDIEYCENESQNVKYICEINNEDWYGSETKTELPKNELKSLAIFIDGKYIKLDVSQMFNPNFSGELNKSQFQIKKFKHYYLLFGFFSDGAGTYTAHWKIQNEKAERIKISNNDEDFQWQNFK
ncbi:hypothetical protein [Chryseobacterium gambrini]|uniref:Uncharacterized protein n=1 Tax=Chryseobacterium gambrini TaxID=373672 RepID=A0A1N7Q5R9_9FLAO|nr:hypothetical protein [Chryseobacterium gambrini]SIT18059.1 hypothetical protein SAMN05421785_10953 [Chryseobacterium gambrini]